MVFYERGKNFIYAVFSLFQFRCDHLRGKLAIFRPLNPQQCLIGPPFGITNGFTKLDMMLALDHGRVPSSGFPGYIYSDYCNSVLSSDIVHRKSSSMDSQIVAEHSRLAS